MYTVILLPYMALNFKPCHRIHLCNFIRFCQHVLLNHLRQPPHMMQSFQSIQQSKAMQHTLEPQSDITREPNPTYQMSIQGQVNYNTTDEVQGEYEYLPVPPDVHDQQIINAGCPPSYTDDYIL